MFYNNGVETNFKSASLYEANSARFPVNVSEVYNSLPRPLNRNGVVLVKPPESTSSTVSVPSSDQTTSTSNGPESARASISTMC